MSGLLPNALHVARREYLVRVRGRAFKVTTAVLALLVIGVIFLPTILAAAGVDEPPKVAVVVEADDVSSDAVVASVESALAGLGADENAQVVVEDDPAAAEQAVRDGDYDGLLTVTRADDGELAFEFLGSASPTNQIRQAASAAARQIAVADRLSREGVAPEQQAQLFEPPAFEATPIDPDDARNEEDFGGAFILAYAVVILTFMAILTYGNWVAQSVAEEKSGRVMELLITAASPRQLLTGKVLGAGGAGLTQYLAIVAAVVIGLAAQGPVSSALGVSGSSQPFQMPTLDPLTPLAFAAFFLLGFILYATLYAAAGSMVSRIEDVQQAVGPLIFLAMAGYFAAFAGLNDPNADWVRLLSLVPFFSPYLMPARMLLSSPAPAEILGAIALLAVTVVGAMWIASRIYSAGVLLYGQRVGIRSVLRATRVAR